MLEYHKNKLEEEKEIRLTIKVNPGSAKSQIKNIMTNGVIKIDIAAAPEKGKANKELIKFLSKEFGVNKNDIEIKSGETEKLKVVKIILSY